MDTQKSLPKRFGQLLMSLVIIWALTFQVLPFISGLSSNFRQLAAFIDASGIETGQFFYTGVEIVAHAESGARGSIYFAEQQQKK